MRCGLWGKGLGQLPDVYQFRAVMGSAANFPFNFNPFYSEANLASRLLPYRPPPRVQAFTATFATAVLLWIRTDAHTTLFSHHTIPFNLNFPSRPRPRHCLTRLERHRLASSSASRSSRVFSPSHTSASSSVLVAASAAATLAATGPVLFQQKAANAALSAVFQLSFLRLFPPHIFRWPLSQRLPSSVHRH